MMMKLLKLDVFLCVFVFSLREREKKGWGDITTKKKGGKSEGSPNG